MQYLKEVFAKWWAESKSTLLSLLVLFLTLLFGGGAVAYEVGQRQVVSSVQANLQAAQAVAELVCPDGRFQALVTEEGDVSISCVDLITPPVPTVTPVAVTPTPGRVTNTPVQPVPTSTKPPEGTPTPTKLPEVTVTPGATSTPIAGGICFGWHPFGLDATRSDLPPHHHGYNPCDYIELFGAELEEYLTTNGPFGYPLSGPLEEHEGLVWLYTHLDQCELFVTDLDNLPNPVGCVTDALVRVHTAGTQAHGSKRFHSEVAFVRGCDQARTTCGTTMIMVPQVDYGVLFNPYKQAICHLDGEPTDATGATIIDVNQPPYRGLQPPAFRGIDPPAFWNPAEVFASEIWSSLRIAANNKFYPNNPNSLVQVTWTLMDAKEYFVCGGEPVKVANNDASRFMFFTLRIQDLPPARPFSGFVDFYGHLADNCTEVGPLCFPIYISEGFPTYPVWFNYEVRQNGDNPKVLQMEFNP